MDNYLYIVSGDGLPRLYMGENPWVADWILGCADEEFGDTCAINVLYDGKRIFRTTSRSAFAEWCRDFKVQVPLPTRFVKN